MIPAALRSVIPTDAAMSRTRAVGSAAMHVRTCAWFVTNRHAWKSLPEFMFMNLCYGTRSSGSSRKEFFKQMHPEQHESKNNGSARPFEVVVIGGGQAGLAMGYYLRQQARRFVIFERGDSIAPAWGERWDSLTPFTPRRHSALPGVPFPGDPDGYPTRDEVIAYLERYAGDFELPIELKSEVKRLERREGGFILELDDRTITADQVVVATGPFQTPYVPKLADRLETGVFQTHATSYLRPDELPPGTALVVGGGNTGFQIAKELSATHKVMLSVGS